MNEAIRKWHARRVWIVGASSGIGAALAAQLLARGARVALSARDHDRLLAMQAGADQGQTLVLPFDVTDSTAWPRALRQIELAWGGVDLVVFLAGSYAPVRAWELTPENARRMVETNLLGVMTGVATVLPGLLQRGDGGFAIVASVAGYRGLPKALVYGPTKAALINFAQVLHIDLKPRGISVYLVNPGFVATPLTARNDFKMPALMSPDAAAMEIIAGLADGVFEIHFPKRFTCVMKLLAWLPDGLYYRLMARLG